MTTKQTKMTLPSMLAFERKLETSDALMYAGNQSDISDKWREDSWKKIKITQRFNRSTQSSAGIDDTKKTEPNPISSGNDDANLPEDKDTLKVSFSLRVIGNVGQPHACNEPDFEKSITSKVVAGKENITQELASRYAYNIANGRFLWRNRVGAETVTIHVFIDKEEKPLEFDAFDFSLKNFDKNKSHSHLEKLKNAIQEGLLSENKFRLLQVNAYVQFGEGQHVFPSEEMNMNEKGKKLFQLNGCAAMHNVKIGNAIRTIDTWYGDKALVKLDGKKTDTIEIFETSPIAIEPYGSVTQRGIAYRPSNNDLYTLMLRWINDSDISPEDKYYVTANIIRGGVFSKK